MFMFLTTFLLSSIFFQFSTAQPTNTTYITCGDGSTSCASTDIICPPDQPCMITCNGPSYNNNQTACYNTSITCPSNQYCSLTCYYQGSCSYMTLDASQSSELTMKSYKSYSTIHSTILCPIGGNCTISCFDRSCQQSYINAYKSDYVLISDGSQLSYVKSIINATNARFLYIKAATWYGFRKAIIYCPNNGPKIANGLGYSCKIDASIYNWWSMSESKIYAVEGMNDVELIGHGFYWEDPILYCDKNYNTSCDLSWDYTKVYCDSNELDGTICETYLLPTLNPTIIPSEIPTNVPSVIPSDIPTVIPSLLPSVIPSAIPSKEPSNIPSSMPTGAPFVSSTAMNVVRNILNTTSSGLDVVSGGTNVYQVLESTQSVYGKNSSKSDGNVINAGVIIGIIFSVVFICSIMGFIGWKMFKRYKLKKGIEFERLGAEINQVDV